VCVTVNTSAPNGSPWHASGVIVDQYAHICPLRTLQATVEAAPVIAVE
jgi:hypothetical protein